VTRDAWVREALDEWDEANEYDDDPEDGMGALDDLREATGGAYDRIDLDRLQHDLQHVGVDGCPFCAEEARVLAAAPGAGVREAPRGGAEDRAGDRSGGADVHGPAGAEGEAMNPSEERDGPPGPRDVDVLLDRIAKLEERLARIEQRLDARH
jgi:hypothetical protein